MKPFKPSNPTGSNTKLVEWGTGDYLDRSNGGFGANVSTNAQACTAIGAQIASEKNASNGYAGLTGTKLLVAHLPTTVAQTSQANTYTANFKQSVTHGAANAGLRIVPATAGTGGDPDNPQDGDIWYNATAQKLRFRQNGATLDVETTGTAGNPGGTTEDIQFHTGSTFGGSDDFTRNYSSGESRTRITVGDATNRGVVRIYPKAGDPSGGDVNDGDLWYDATAGYIKARQNGVSSALGISYDTSGRIQSSLIRPRNVDYSSGAFLKVPGQEFFRTVGFHTTPTIRGTCTSADDSTAPWLEFSDTINNGLITTCLDEARSEWDPDVTFLMKTLTDINNLRLWFGVFEHDPYWDANCAYRGIGALKFDSSENVKWRYFANNGSATSQNGVASSVADVTGDTVYRLRVHVKEASTYFEINDEPVGSFARKPVESRPLMIVASCTPLNAATRGFALSSVYMEYKNG